MIASSAVVAGVSWWQAWICVWIGYTFAAAFICATGRIGAVYHIGFPVASRASFGIWGGLWPVFNRAVMACVWYGVQSWIGKQSFLSTQGGMLTLDRWPMCHPYDLRHLATIRPTPKWTPSI